MKNQQLAAERRQNNRNGAAMSGHLAVNQCFARHRLRVKSAGAFLRDGSRPTRHPPWHGAPAAGNYGFGPGTGGAWPCFPRKAGAGVFTVKLEIAQKQRAPAAHVFFVKPNTGPTRSEPKTSKTPRVFTENQRKQQGSRQGRESVQRDQNASRPGKTGNKIAAASRPANAGAGQREYQTDSRRQPMPHGDDVNESNTQRQGRDQDRGMGR